MNWHDEMLKIEDELRCVRSRIRFKRFGIFNEDFWKAEEQRLIRNRNEWLKLKP